MSGMAAAHVREVRPGGLISLLDRRLAPDHPFLRKGTWRAFVTGDGRDQVRVVASLDPRHGTASGLVGAIGFIACGDDLRAPAVGAAMRSSLAAAEAWLVDRSAAVVRCPVQFSTWYGHRAMTDGFPEHGGPAPFFMEPVNGPGLSEVLIGAGFAVAHTAASYLVAVDRAIEGAQLGEELMRSAGFRDRPIRLDRLDDELETLHALSMAAFRGSWGFSEIALDEFVSIYRPLAPLVDPDFVRIAESSDGRPVGFIFAFADPGAGSGRLVGTFVAKSVAVLPEVRRLSPGIGSGLAAAVHRSAAARGYGTAIHACVAEEAYSQRVSARWGERFRSYATFEKVLRPPPHPA